VVATVTLGGDPDGVVVTPGRETRFGRWIEAVHGRRPPKGVVLDMNSNI